MFAYKNTATWNPKNMWRNSVTTVRPFSNYFFASKIYLDVIRLNMRRNNDTRAFVCYIFEPNWDNSFVISSYLKTPCTPWQIFKPIFTTNFTFKFGYLKILWTYWSEAIDYISLVILWSFYREKIDIAILYHCGIEFQT